jgi:hypothetical protein
MLLWLQAGGIGFCVALAPVARKARIFVFCLAGSFAACGWQRQRARCYFDKRERFTLDFSLSHRHLTMTHHQQLLKIQTAGKSLCKITSKVEAVVAESGVGTGLCTLFLDRKSVV